MVLVVYSLLINFIAQSRPTCSENDTVHRDGAHAETRIDKECNSSANFAKSRSWSDLGNILVETLSSIDSRVYQVNSPG